MTRRPLRHITGTLLNRQNSDDNLMRSKTYGWQLHNDEIAQATQPVDNQQWIAGETMSFMLYRVSADAVVILHFLFILFVILGGFLVLRNRKWIFLHLPAALWAATLEFQGWICPLTPLENRLREQGNQGTYDMSFVEHYLVPVLYPSALSPGIQTVLGVTVIFINTAVYFQVYRMIKRKAAEL